MVVLEIFNIKNRGTAVIFDPEINFFELKLNQIVRRISDNQEWIISGIEKWSHGRNTGAFLLKGDAPILIGDDLVLVEA